MQDYMQVPFHKKTCFNESYLAKVMSKQIDILA